MGNSNVTFKENSSIRFTSNSAMHGGGICAENKSDIFVRESSTVAFVNNFADINGGAILSYLESVVNVNGDTKLLFYNNVGGYMGELHIFKQVLLSYFKVIVQ